MAPKPLGLPQRPHEPAPQLSSGRRASPSTGCDAGAPPHPPIRPQQEVMWDLHRHTPPPGHPDILVPRHRDTLPARTSAPRQQDGPLLMFTSRNTHENIAQLQRDTWPNIPGLKPRAPSTAASSRWTVPDQHPRSDLLTHQTLTPERPLTHLGTLTATHLTPHALLPTNLRYPHLGPPHPYTPAATCTSTHTATHLYTWAPTLPHSHLSTLAPVCPPRHTLIYGAHLHTHTSDTGTPCPPTWVLASLHLGILTPGHLHAHSHPALHLHPHPALSHAPRSLDSPDPHPAIRPSSPGTGAPLPAPPAAVTPTCRNLARASFSFMRPCDTR